MSGRKRRDRHASDELSDDSSHPSENPLESNDDRSRQPAKPKKRRRWVFAVALIVALLALLPNLIGWLGLHQSVVNYATQGMGINVRVGSLSAGWMQPIELTSVSVQDDSGNVLFETEGIRTSASLVRLISSEDLGMVDLDHPTFHIELTQDSSNLEQTLAAVLASPRFQTPATDQDASNRRLPDLQINIRSGAARIRSTQSPIHWKSEQVDGSIRMGSHEAPLLLNLSAQVTPITTDAQGVETLDAPGQVSIAGTVDAGQAALTFASAEFGIKTQQLPLSVFGPGLERSLGPTATSGRVTGQLQAYYSQADQSIAIDVERFNGESIKLASTGLLGDDQLQIQSIDVNGNLQLTPNLIFAKSFSLDSDLGKLNANGNFDLQQLSELAQRGQLADASFQMDGSVELAKLLKMLPGTLQLHQDLDVTSGTVSFQVNSQPRDEATGSDRKLVVNVDTANIRANRGGQSIVWAKPIRLAGTISERSQQLNIDNLLCESEFLNLEGQGNLQTASFKATGDLGLLTQRIGQFIDLQETRLAGQLDGEFGWQLRPGAQIDPQDPLNQLPLQLVGSMLVERPLIELTGIPKWQPEQLKIRFSATGKTRKRAQPLPGTVIDASYQSDANGYALRLDDGGSLQVDIGNERAVVTLSEPVNDALNHPRWVGNCRITGGLDRWLAHAKNFIDLGPIAGAGDLDLTSAVVLTESELEFGSAQYKIDQLGFQGYGLSLAEPSAEGNAAGKFDLTSGSLLFSDLTLIASSISARARNLSIAYPSNLRVDGDVAYRANVNRVAQWLELSPDQDSLFWFGSAEGQLRFQSSESGIGIQTDSTLTDLIAAVQSPVIGQPTGPVVQASNPRRQWNAVWQDAKLRVLGGVVVGNDFDSLTFQNAQIESESLTANVNGTAKEVSTLMRVDVTGTWKPDWIKLNALISHYAGEALQFEGNGMQTFSLQGPLFETNGGHESSIVSQPQGYVPSGLKLKTDLGWLRGSVLGLPVGASQLDVVLENGLAKVSTPGIPFAGGQVKLSPTVDLRTANPVAYVEPTRVIDQVELKPETARQWLRYVAPLAADATSAQGTFSFDLSQAAIPLLNPQQMQAQGTVTLSKVVIGAGPLAQQLLGSVKQIRRLLKPDAEDRDMSTWMRMSEQNIPIAVRDGRVFHEKLDFSHKDLVIRTRGSVGFDQSLQMIAEIPIADDWIAGKKYLEGLKGQSLKIPIGGTVSKPKLNRDSIEQLSRDLVKQAAASAVNNAVQDKLNPKINQFQQKLNNKINGQFNKFQQDLQKKLGIGPADQGSDGKPATGGGLPRLPKPADLLEGLLPSRSGG